MSKLSPEQFAAIRASIVLGRTLQTECPEIADLYRKDFSLTKIIETLDIQSRYGVNVSVASRGVYKSIAGHEKGFDFDSYVGLIPDEERRILGKKHMDMSGSLYGHLGGTKTYEERAGCHGVNPETGMRYCEEGGKKGGTLGGRKGGPDGGRQHAIAKGQTPWIRVGEVMKDGSICKIAEVEFAYVQSHRPEYGYLEGHNHHGSPNWQRITEELNEVYHNSFPVRNPNAVCNKIYKKYRMKSM